MNRMMAKVGLYTGAARGQGAIGAELLAREGAVVYLADVLDDQGEETAALLRDEGYNVHFLHLDVCEPNSWHDAIAHIHEEQGRIDFLINNAGIAVEEGITLTNVELWNRVLAINLTGPFLGINAVSPLMTASGGGSIVNIGSLSALNGLLAGVYTVSKWGLRGLTKTAANELAETGIRVNAVHPAMVRTDMARGDDNIGAMAEMTPLQRIAEPHEVAAAVLFLASDESSYITGIDLPVDGGFSAGSGERQVGLRNGRIPRAIQTLQERKERLHPSLNHSDA